MDVYRERLWAAAWTYIATALIIPACLLVFAPISLTAGIVSAVVLYAAAAGALTYFSPVLRISDGEFHAGRAHIPLTLVGHASGYRGHEAFLERGPHIDARAWLLIRASVGPVVKIEIADENDPTPYWLVSSRHPERLVAALNGVLSQR